MDGLVAEMASAGVNMKLPFVGTYTPSYTLADIDLSTDCSLHWESFRPPTRKPITSHAQIFLRDIDLLGGSADYGSRGQNFILELKLSSHLPILGLSSKNLNNRIHSQGAETKTINRQKWKQRNTIQSRI